MSAGDSLPVLSMDAAFEAPADVVSPQQVEWRGVDWHQVLAFALMWEVVRVVFWCCRPWAGWLGGRQGGSALPVGTQVAFAGF